MSKTSAPKMVSAAAPQSKQSPAQLGAWLLEQCREVGFDDAALVRADTGTPDAERIVQLVDKGLQDALPFMQESAAMRADIKTRMPDAKSVLVVVQNYFSGHPEEAPSDEHLRISRYAWGKDYHQVMKRKLVKLRKRLMAYAQAFPADDDNEPVVSVFNDASPVAERAWAIAAGLGDVGKSSMFIHRQLGTWVFLGGLVTNIDLQAPAMVDGTDRCGSCNACIEKCPTGAITAPFEVDAGLCLSTWTVERPLEDVADASLFVGHDWAVGCDVCQEVCPWNKFEVITAEQRFHPIDGHVWLAPNTPPQDLAGTPLARPGEEGLLRNAARATSGKTTSASCSLAECDDRAPFVAAFLRHARPILTSWWRVCDEALDELLLRFAEHDGFKPKGWRKRRDAQLSDEKLLEELVAELQTLAKKQGMRRGKRPQALNKTTRARWVRTLLFDAGACKE
ncbi:MAG: tRNA epoxyqueuosine(34) reductase QueG [Deltaproteobacteria bacterium]|nr:tRNA epoxyqueuosine(34) reductase QueG [Deltaproteobacteria bacterium]